MHVFVFFICLLYTLFRSESERVQVSIAEMEADHRALEDSLATRSARFVELHKSLATLSAASKPL